VVAELMRARNIKPGFFKNEQLAELPADARLLYIGLWCMADREGRLEDRPKRIKMEVFPADSCDCEPMLSGLAREGLIVRYEIDGARYIEIPRFTEHQSPHYSEKPSEIPPPIPDDSGKNAASSGGDSGELHNRHPLNPDSLNPDSLNALSERDAAPVDKSVLDWQSVDGLFLEWWQLWLAHRRSRRLPPYKDLRMAKRLAKYPHAIQQAAIEESMTQNWQGIFPDKVKANGTNRQTGTTRRSFDEHTERLREWLEDQIGTAQH
jgi:hypothetical protein